MLIKKIGRLVTGTVLATVLVSGTFACSANTPSNDDKYGNAKSINNSNAMNAYAAIASKDIAIAHTEADFSGDLENPYYFFETEPIAALITIDSIDGGRNYSPVYDQYVFPQTYGKLTIVETLKGDAKAGEQLSYSRIGGIITHDDYLKGLNPEQLAKYQSLSKDAGEPQAFVQEKFAGDIDLEVGKTYLAFLSPRVSKNGSYQEYSLEGMQYGLHEAKNPASKSSETYLVLNNETGEWVPLTSFVKFG